MHGSHLFGGRRGVMTNCPRLSEAPYASTQCHVLSALGGLGGESSGEFGLVWTQFGGFSKSPAESAAGW